MYNLFRAETPCTATPDATVLAAEDAAALVSIFGDASIVLSQDTGRIVWTQGESYDGDAGESYDGAADVMRMREAVQRKVRAMGLRR